MSTLTINRLVYDGHIAYVDTATSVGLLIPSAATGKVSDLDDVRIEAGRLFGVALEEDGGSGTPWTIGHRVPDQRIALALVPALDSDSDDDAMPNWDASWAMLAREAGVLLTYL